MATTAAQSAPNIPLRTSILGAVSMNLLSRLKARPFGNWLPLRQPIRGIKVAKGLKVTA